MRKHSILQKLGFEHLSEFIKRSMGIEIAAENIFIKCDVEIPVVGSQFVMNASDILSIVLEQSENGNQISQGYNRQSKHWHWLNTSRNILKSKKWADIFTKLGSEYSLFLLRNAVIVEKIAENYVLLCGSIPPQTNKNNIPPGISKDTLFYGRAESFAVDINYAVDSILRDLNIPSSAYESLCSKIAKVFSKYEKLPIKSMFKSYIVDKYSSKLPRDSTNIFEYEIKANTVADFLFLISKKMLRPVLNYKSFRILKGKITLFLKRNMYEMITLDELVDHFEMAHFKLFNGTACISNQLRITIVKRLMSFIFTSVYLRVISFFFYSTTASFSKMKVYYFARVDWNRKINKFFREHLKAYEKCPKFSNPATLRCIPKENGFRVITNCSRVNSHNVKKQKQHEANLMKAASKNSYFPRNVSVGEFNQEKRLLSIPILNTKYDDISEIMGNMTIQTKNVAKPRNQQDTKLVKNFIPFKAVNIVLGSLLPIIRNVAVKNQHYSLLRHSHVNKKLIPYLRSNNERKILLKIDLTKCFDNIPQDDLLKILDIVLTEDHYNFRDLVVIKENSLDNKIETKYIKLSPEILYPMNMPESQHEEYFNNIGIRADCIIKESSSKIIPKSEIMGKLTELIKNTTVVHQNQGYKSKKGIPQGCNISSLLCSIYYSFLDKMFPMKDCFITRYIDDFLVVTTNIDHIKEFFSIAESLEDRGFIINRDKIRSNIDIANYGSQDKPVFISDHIEWCGLKIYDTGVNIKSVCKDPYFRSNVFISSTSRGVRMFTKIKKSMFIKLNRVCVCNFNKKLGECIFDLFYFAARRLKIMALRCSFINMVFVERVLQWCIDEVLNTLKNRGITFDRSKIENMANKAFDCSGIRSLNKRKFQ